MMIHKSTNKISFILAIMILFWFALPCYADNITYHYDELNRLIQTEYPDGTVIEYTYDAAGNRLTKVIQGGQLSSFSIFAPDSVWDRQGATGDTGNHSHSD